MALADPALLDKIDQLFAFNVGEYIDLPQLVVVGDQSSGKSSILEGLIKLRFPRNSGLCTRFATQILFRRDPSLRSRRMTGSIISATHHDENNACWSVTDIETLSATKFESMMTEVGILLNTASVQKLNSSVVFSHDSNHVASGSLDRTIKIWDAHTSAYLQTLEGHDHWVTSVVFSHDSSRVASGSDDETIKIWDVHTGACLQTLSIDSAVNTSFRRDRFFSSH